MLRRVGRCTQRPVCTPPPDRGRSRGVEISASQASSRRVISGAGGEVTASKPHGSADLALGLVFALAGVAAVLWAGGEASSWISGHGLLHGRPLGGLAALAHLGDPSAAWRAPVGSPGTYWTATTVVLALSGLLAFGAWRLWHLDLGARKTASPSRRGARIAGRGAPLGRREPSWPAPRRSGRPCNTRVHMTSDTASAKVTASRAGRRWRTRCCCWGHRVRARAKAS